MVMDCKNRTGAPPAMDTGDWRSQLQIDTRRTIVNLIMEALKRTLPSPGQKVLQVLEQIARRYEEIIYVAATSESDYLGKTCLKLLAIEKNPLPNALISNSAGNSSSSLDPGVAHSTQPQVKNQTQSIPVPLSAWRSQACPQFISPNIQNNLVSSGVQSSTSLPSATPPVSGLAQEQEVKLQQEMGVKSGVFQQDIAAGPCTAYSRQPIKSGLSFPVSSSQLLQDASPQLPQRSSPQSKQENLACFLTKTGTPLQSAKSPSVVPSSTPLAPSLLPRGKESRTSSICSLSNAENIELLQTTGSHTSALSLGIHNPGISASSLPVELPSPDNGHDSPSVTVCGKSDVTEHPLDRLIKVVKCMSPQALSASISEIASVVSMIDRIAGSAPGNWSTAAVGEDFVAITNYRLHAREVMMQDGKGRKRKIGCFASAFPSSVALSTDSSNQLTVPEAFKLDSSSRPSVKKPRIEANHARLVEIARELDDCAQQTQTGGGSFSSKYGTWENCASVA